MIRVTRKITCGGRYWTSYAPAHPHADRHGFVLEHRLVVEKAIGMVLSRHSNVHHVNGDGLDNRPANLVACEDMAYHKLLHRRERALNACGHADWEQCVYCKTWEPPGRLSKRAPSINQWQHNACMDAYRKERGIGRGLNNRRRYPKRTP